MSNIGLPGFWPHAFLYAGTFPEMDAYFKADTATARTVRGLSGGACSTLTAYLATAFPEQARWYGEPADDRGPRRVIEARSEGVVFTSLTEACAGDYIGAVRPRLTRQGKAVALIQAFSYGGRPYDFDFDFASDAALVCTEVVYKAYQKRPESRGVSFDLVEILGRLTLPPNRMVAQFDREYGTENRQADFVAFIDASEKQGRSFFSDAAGFRKSHLRPKWDFLLD